jgi:hypothetical protein
MDICSKFICYCLSLSLAWTNTLAYHGIRKLEMMFQNYKLHIFRMIILIHYKVYLLLSKPGAITLTPLIVLCKKSN